MSENSEITEVAEIIAATNAATIQEPIKLALVRDLGPIADRIPLYQQKAKEIVVDCEGAAVSAATACDEIAEDLKLVKDNEVLGRITNGLHGLHKRWVGLRDRFVTPLEASRKEIKGKVLSWQETERVKAEEETRRLQAAADEKARREQEALLKKSASMKTEAKQVQYQEAAQAVIAPTVVVEAPKSGMRVSRVWTVKSVDEAKFFAALATDRNLQGFVTIERTKLARGKAANPSMTIPGVEFIQQVR